VVIFIRDSTPDKSRAMRELIHLLSWANHWALYLRAFVSILRAGRVLQFVRLERACGPDGWKISSLLFLLLGRAKSTQKVRTSGRSVRAGKVQQSLFLRTNPSLSLCSRSWANSLCERARQLRNHFGCLKKGDVLFHLRENIFAAASRKFQHSRTRGKIWSLYFRQSYASGVHFSYPTCKLRPQEWVLRRAITFNFGCEKARTVDAIMLWTRKTSLASAWKCFLRCRCDSCYLPMLKS